MHCKFDVILPYLETKTFYRKTFLSATVQNTNLVIAHELGDHSDVCVSHLLQSASLPVQQDGLAIRHHVTLSRRGSGRGGGGGGGRGGLWVGVWGGGDGGGGEGGREKMMFAVRLVLYNTELR